MTTTKILGAMSAVGTILFLVQGKLVECGLWGIITILCMILSELEELNQTLKKK